MTKNGIDITGNTKDISRGNNSLNKIAIPVVPPSKTHWVIGMLLDQYLSEESQFQSEIFH